jgi:hypothetical protein
MKASTDKPLWRRFNPLNDYFFYKVFGEKGMIAGQYQG